MKEHFGDVQKNFMELGIFLSSLDFERDLQKQSVLDKLNSELKKSYALFEAGLCDNVPVCTKCERSQAELRELVALVNRCTQEGFLTDEARSALNDFVTTIPRILSEMKKIYLESLLDISSSRP